MIYSFTQEACPFDITKHEALSLEEGVQWNHYTKLKIPKMPRVVVKLFDTAVLFLDRIGDDVRCSHQQSRATNEETRTKAPQNGLARDVCYNWDDTLSQSKLNRPQIYRLSHYDIVFDRVHTAGIALGRIQRDTDDILDLPGAIHGLSKYGFQKFQGESFLEYPAARHTCGNARCRERVAIWNWWRGRHRESDSGASDRHFREAD